MNENFPIIKICGSAEERGRQHGSLLKERIHRTIAFYRKQFSLPEEEVLAIARHFREKTRGFSEDLYVEIETLALAADVDPLWIYALNGRTEQPSVEAMKVILMDHADEDYPICRRRFSHPWLTDDTSITVATIIMDLKNLEFHIARGNPFDHPFSVFSVTSRAVR